MKKIFLFFIFPLFLHSNTIENKVKNEIQKVIRTDEQRKIYNKLEENKKIILE